MRTFAYIVSPRTIKRIRDIWPSARFLPAFVIKGLLKRSRPVKAVYIKGIKSIQGEEIAGYIVLCPLTDIMDTFAENLLMETLIFCENLGVAVVGLDEHLSSVAARIYEKIDKKIKVTITDGNAFTAWSILEAIYRYAKIKGLELKELGLFVIGRESALGKLCEKKLSEYVGKIAETSKDADIVISLYDYRNSAVYVAEGMKLGAIFCEAYSFDGGNAKIMLKDAVFIKSGLVKLPYPVNIKIKTRLPQGIIWASLAETMLLTFTKRFSQHYFGSDINPDNLEEVANIAVQYGFEVWVPQAPIL